MVELRGVHYVAGGARILDDVSVRFHPRRFNVILGPNGAGKSTLLRIAAGLLRPTAGEVRYGDRSLASLSPDALARTRAVLSQRVELAFPLPVRDVVLMGRYPHYGRAPSARDREIVERALALVGMTERSEQAYPTLSGGEQQKVQMARVLAQIWSDGEHDAARLLFLDEPTTSLDVHYQIHLLDVARGLLASHCTVVAILHDLNVALQYGDALFVLEHGRVVHEGERGSALPRALIERVFRVKARWVSDPAGGSEEARDAPGPGEGFWRFRL